MEGMLVLYLQDTKSLKQGMGEGSQTSLQLCLVSAVFPDQLSNSHSGVPITTQRH